MLLQHPTHHPPTALQHPMHHPPRQRLVEVGCAGARGNGRIGGRIVRPGGSDASAATSPLVPLPIPPPTRPPLPIQPSLLSPSPPSLLSLLSAPLPSAAPAWPWQGPST